MDTLSGLKNPTSCKSTGADLGGPWWHRQPLTFSAAAENFQKFKFSTTVQPVTFPCTPYCEILRLPLLNPPCYIVFSNFWFNLQIILIFATKIPSLKTKLVAPYIIFITTVGNFYNFLEY